MNDATGPTGDGHSTVLASSAVMAAGTAVSRLSGYVRSILLAAALGNLLHADVFTFANTIPNMLYILLAGGAINAVLVPQLVRAGRVHEDAGEAYTSRVVTLVGLFLAVVTVALVAAAPWVMQLLIDPRWSDTARDSTVDLARYCLPQVFFYGMFTLVGQILNARGTFGPMMWAPIANNLISIGALVAYLVVFGADDPTVPGYSTGRELLLGLGSTLGIAVQLAVLIPYLRAAGVRLRPRFDFRDAGLSHTLRLGVWTVLFVIVNQIAYTVVLRLAGSGTASGSVEGTGATIYTQTFLIMMVPHSIVTVSLATAILPRLSGRAADGDLAGLGADLAPTLRTALTVVVPFAALLPVVAPLLAEVLWGYGAAAPTVENYMPTLRLFGPGLVLFTVHYLMLRGFYALEQNRTVFLIQCAVAATNIAVGVTLVTTTSARDTSPALVGAYTAAYAVGAVLSYAVLRSRLGGLQTAPLLSFLSRLLVAVAIASACAVVVARLVDPPSYDSAVIDKAAAIAEGLAIGLVDLAVLVLLARVLRISEINSLIGLVTRRTASSRP